MLLHDLGRGLLRRWYFVVCGIVLTACGALLITTVVPPTYQGSARIVLIPPKSLVTADGNPYLYLGGLEQALGVLSVRLNSGAVATQIGQGNAGRSYAIEKDPIAPGPIMVITAEGESPETTLSVLDDVLKTVPQDLEGMQDQLNIPAASRITAMTVVRENEPKMVLKSQLRAVLAGVAVGLSLTILLTGLLDRLLLSRRINARRRQSPDLGDAPKIDSSPVTPEHEHDSRATLQPKPPQSGGSQANADEYASRALQDEYPSRELQKEERPTMASNT